MKGANNQLIVSTFCESGQLRLSLNGEMILEGTGQASRVLSPGKAYQLSWQAVGATGANYRISVSSPPEAEFSWSRRIGKAGLDAHSFLFKI